jgi:hypothetical protein
MLNKHVYKHDESEPLCRTELVSVKAITPYLEYDRMITTKNSSDKAEEVIQKLASNLDQNGFFEPAILQAFHTTSQAQLIEGNHRHAAAKFNNYNYFPVKLVSMPGAPNDLSDNFNIEMDFGRNVLLPSQLGFQVFQTTDSHHPYFPSQLLQKIQQQMPARNWKNQKVNDAYHQFITQPMEIDG